MKARFRNLAAIGLAVLLAGCVIGWLMTRDANPLRIAKKAAPTDSTNWWRRRRA